MNNNLYTNSEEGFIENNLSEEQMISLSDIFYLLRQNWYYFIACLLIALICGYVYIKSTPNSYERTASVLVNTKSDMSGPLADIMKISGTDIGGIKGNDKIENEIIIFRTERLLSRVIDELNLRVTYRKKEGIRSKKLYKETPIRLTLLNTSDTLSGSFSLSFIEENKVSLSNFEGDFEQLSSAPKMIVSLGETIETPIGSFFLTSNTIATSKKEPIEIIVNSKEKTVADLSKKLTISQSGKQSSVIDLRFKDENTDFAEDFLNTLISQHDVTSRSEKLKIAHNTEAFINDRITIISKELGDVDQEIERFKQNNQIANIASEAEVYIESSKEITKQTIEVNNALAVAGFIKEHLTNPSSANGLIPASSGLEDLASNSLIKEYNTLYLYREQLLSESGQTNPLIETQQKQLESLRKAIIKSIDNYIKSLNIKLSSINKQSDKNEGKISSVPMQERIITSIYRNQKIKEELYLFLLNAREKNALSIEGAVSDVQLIQPAVGSSTPIAPKKALIMLAALVLGLLIPAAHLYIRFMMNNTVRGRKDLETYTQIPILGEVPHSTRLEKKQNILFHKFLDLFRSPGKRHTNKRYQRRANMLLGSKIERDFVSESFSVLRSNMAFMLTGEECKIITLTSALPNSGKTFVAANLAHSFGTLQKRVLLIDGDIRKGSLTAALRLNLSKQTEGLSAYLSNSSLSVEDVVVPHNDDVIFDFLPAGVFPPNPSELLLSPRFEELISILRTLYDYIIIDAVPFMNMADAQIIAKACDLTLMVVREGSTPRALLREINFIHKNKYFEKVALVLNDAGSSQHISGRGYGYQYYSSEYQSYFSQK